MAQWTSFTALGMSTSKTERPRWMQLWCKVGLPGLSLWHGHHWQMSQLMGAEWKTAYFFLISKLALTASHKGVADLLEHKARTSFGTYSLSRSLTAVYFLGTWDCQTDFSWLHISPTLHSSNSSPVMYANITWYTIFLHIYDRSTLLGISSILYYR